MPAFRVQDVRRGDIVHYTYMPADKKGHLDIAAALVVNELKHDGDVSLKVFFPDGSEEFMELVEFTSHNAGESASLGKWSFPVGG